MAAPAPVRGEAAAGPIERRGATMKAVRQPRRTRADWMTVVTVCGALGGLTVAAQADTGSSRTTSGIVLTVAMSSTNSKGSEFATVGDVISTSITVTNVTGQAKAVTLSSTDAFRAFATGQ